MCYFLFQLHIVHKISTAADLTEAVTNGNGEVAVLGFFFVVSLFTVSTVFLRHASCDHLVEAPFSHKL